MNTGSDKNKLNVFLDLDNTIIYSDVPKDKKKYLNMATGLDPVEIDPFITIPRPYLQILLDFLFLNCNVNIWTAGSGNYASKIHEKFIKKYRFNRNLGLILYSDHVDMSTKIKGGHKDLSMLWDYWNIPGYNKDNTIIIDDNEQVKNIQPDRCIRVKYFTIDNARDDTEMISIIPLIKDHIRRYEKTIKNN